MYLPSDEIFFQLFLIIRKLCVTLFDNVSHRSIIIVSDHQKQNKQNNSSLDGLPSSQANQTFPHPLTELLAGKCSQRGRLRM